MKLSCNGTERRSRARAAPRLVRRNRLQTNSVLKELGVEFKAGASFFHSNEGRLEFIFHDFQNAARRALAEHHPDHGGDTENFQNLLSKIQMVRRSFARFGIGSAFDRRKPRFTRNPPAFIDRKYCRAYAKRYNKQWRTAQAIYNQLRWLMKKDAEQP